jgi:hypothetical protein
LEAVLKPSGWIRGINDLLKSIKGSQASELVQLENAASELEEERRSVVAELTEGADRRKEMLLNEDDDAILAHDRRAEQLHLRIERIDQISPDVTARLRAARDADRREKIRGWQLKYAEACEGYFPAIERLYEAFEKLTSIREQMAAAGFGHEAAALPFVFRPFGAEELPSQRQQILRLRQSAMTLGQVQAKAAFAQQPPAPAPKLAAIKPALPSKPDTVPKVREKIFETAKEGEIQLSVIRPGLEHRGVSCAVGDVIAVPEEAAEKIMIGGAADFYPGAQMRSIP